jgi:DNA-binding NarL/FixJ family response regulator
VELVRGTLRAGSTADGGQRILPRVLLMDLRTPNVDGITAIERIAKLPDPQFVVVLTNFDADQYVLRALRAGAAGFLVSRLRQQT